MAGEIEDDNGEPFDVAFGVFVGFDVGVVGDFRLLTDEFVSLVSDCFSSSLSLFSSELLRASAASMDFLCMPED